MKNENIHPSYQMNFSTENLIDNTSHAMIAELKKIQSSQRKSKFLSTAERILTAICIGVTITTLYFFKEEFQSHTAKNDSLAEQRLVIIDKQLTEVTEIVARMIPKLDINHFERDQINMTSEVNSVDKYVQAGIGGDEALPFGVTQAQVQVVEVAVNKANLRTGPDTGHSPLMSVSLGTRLLVEMEQNGWYRIVAPSGERAWIEASLVSLKNIG